MPFPFRLGRLDLADEGVQMPDQRLADLPDTRIFRAGDALQDRIGDGELVEIAHGCFHSLLRLPTALQLRSSTGAAPQRRGRSSA